MQRACCCIRAFDSGIRDESRGENRGHDPDRHLGYDRVIFDTRPTSGNSQFGVEHVVLRHNVAPRGPVQNQDFVLPRLRPPGVPMGKGRRSRLDR